ncbi:queuosine precursor transporter [Candidatus Woesearchaeota archaeon]|nr:queuosine precursor transporter [Candidatus Woesearchaeota archaeon]
MINELLWPALMVVNYILILLAYRLYGKTGLYVYTAMSIILVNIQVMKTVQLFGYVTAMGNILYGSMFLITDILAENHGKKYAKKAVSLGFFVMVATTVIMQLSLMFVPDASDMLSPSLAAIFGILPRITIASLTAYLISQNLDVFLFGFIRRFTGEKWLWLRNNLSTMISQFFDNVIFTWIAFVGFGIFWEQVFDWPIIISIFLTSYAMKLVVLITDTPIIYLAKRMKGSVPQ